MPTRKVSASRALFDSNDRPGCTPVEVALLYADNMTESMAKAIEETDRGERFSRPTTRKMGSA